MDIDRPRRSLKESRPSLRSVLRPCRLLRFVLENLRSEACGPQWCVTLYRTLSLYAARFCVGTEH